jgi:hypothetical protein
MTKPAESKAASVFLSNMIVKDSFDKRMCEGKLVLLLLLLLVDEKYPIVLIRSDRHSSRTDDLPGC